MTEIDAESEVAPDRLERRWFACMRAASAKRAQCEALLEVMAWSRPPGTSRGSSSAGSRSCAMRWPRPSTELAVERRALRELIAPVGGQDLLRRLKHWPRRGVLPWPPARGWPRCGVCRPSSARHILLREWAAMCGILGLYNCEGDRAGGRGLFGGARSAETAWSGRLGHLAGRAGGSRPPPPVVVDLSPTGHQPMESADRRYTIVFNGEIYNHGICAGS